MSNRLQLCRAWRGVQKHVKELGKIQHADLSDADRAEAARIMAWAKGRGDEQNSKWFVESGCAKKPSGRGVPLSQVMGPDCAVSCGAPGRVSSPEGLCP